MSFLDSPDPAILECATPSIETVIEARPAQLELDGPAVGRVLPSARRRMVGPFVFFDRMGPATFAPGRGIDVRPHPHIGLSTVTYLFEGEIVHRDTLGYTQPIRPGEVNWMTAGRGIAHSERTPPDMRPCGSRLHGIQLWVALPSEEEEREPSFDHYDAAVIPEFPVEGATVRLIAGSGWGRSSPVRTFSPLVYAELRAAEGGSVPLPADVPELSLFIVEGAVTCGEERFEQNRLLVFEPGTTPRFHAATTSHLMVLGGAPLGRRHIWWNFVSSSKERIEQAKRDWKEGRFGKVIGDEIEYVPLPER